MREWRPVDVLHEGQWYAGWVLDQWREQDGWHALVRYTTEPGMTYHHARPATELRRRD